MLFDIYLLTIEIFESIMSLFGINNYTEFIQENKTAKSNRVTDKIENIDINISEFVS